MALRAVPDHPKFADLKMQLGKPRYIVLGCLEAIWHFTGRFCPQGNIGKYSDQAIEAWAEWDGEPGAMVAAMVKSRWIDAHNTHRMVVHDWAEHADKATKNALKRSGLRFCVEKRVRTKGKPVRTCTYKNPDSGNLYGLPEPEPVPEPVPDTKACAEVNSAPALDRSGTPLRLPTLTGEWPVSAVDCMAWAQAYPAVEVDLEMLRMREWLLSNPRNRKTAQGMRKFITNWLSRAQDRSRPGSGANGYGRQYGNRGQARTDGNRNAARIAADRMAARFADGACGSEGGGCERGGTGTLRGDPERVPG